MKTFDLYTLPELGEMPDRMKALVIRPDREGAPEKAMQLEEVPLPPVGPNDVLIMVMGAGVNFNGVWAARGKPVSVFKMHKEPFHIAGSDASGIVWKVGDAVRRWKVGDEVVVHCNQSCGQCPECNGLDPLACSEQKIWGYETSWGSFAQFTRVQAQQLLPKPKQLSWMEAASYGLTYFTAYRMLVHQAEVQPGDNVLVWGAAGGLGVFAIQLCRVLGANPIGVVSSESKRDYLRKLGCDKIVVRAGFELAKQHPDENPGQLAHRTAEMKRFGGEIRKLTGGRDPDVVFEHVGQETFATSVFVAKKFGKIVICGATSGFNLEFDVRHLWMRQKQILGSHFCNAYHADRANRLVEEGKIVPVLDRVFPFHEGPLAHELMATNRHRGKMAIAVQGRASFGEDAAHERRPRHAAHQAA
ncbi:MAG TPA: crotonyl-CoA carboxylase/reductase [Myxococcales bacterium]|nr:crotonyl-CoA carboxylase/reductase [Myxococcales bacterium]